MPIAMAGRPDQAALLVIVAAAAATTLFRCFAPNPLWRVLRRARPQEEMPVRHEVLPVRDRTRHGD